MGLNGLTGLSGSEVERIARKIAKEEIEAYMKGVAKRQGEDDIASAKAQAEGEEAEVVKEIRDAAGPSEAELKLEAEGVDVVDEGTNG